MQVKDLQQLFTEHKEANLFHRYITNAHIEPLLNKLGDLVQIEILGTSVLNKPIYGLQIGSGEKRILMWSQMHGNESTTTKAIFDLINSLLNNHSLKYVLNTCTLYIVPILNPDGAEAYTRVNANQVDLNRDAQNLTQPESMVLRSLFEKFKPDFCYNLHGQRTIFSIGKSNKPATVSFLAPAQDAACTLTSNRKIAMEVIGIMNLALQNIIPNQVGVYDDAFNLNCVGDTFQSKNIPTILFEAGHYPEDYAREKTRELIFVSYVYSLDYIARTNVTGSNFEPYFNIPENEKCFMDVIIRNAKINNELVDIGFQYQEKLKDGKIVFIPKVEKIEKLDGFFAHYEIDAKGLNVWDINKEEILLGSENVFVMINNEKKPLFSK